jgi:hypothetical protein
MSVFNIRNSKIEQINDCGNNYKLVGKDGNNAVAEKGSIAQALGGESEAQVNRPKESFWSALWKKLKGLWGWIAK